MVVSVKTYQHNTGTVACNLCFKVPINVLVSSTIKSGNPPPPSVFIKVAEIIQKNLVELLVFCPMVFPPDLLTSMSYLSIIVQYRNENQSFIPNSVFQFIKKIKTAKFHFRYKD